MHPIVRPPFVAHSPQYRAQQLPHAHHYAHHRFGPGNWSSVPFNGMPHPAPPPPQIISAQFPPDQLAYFAQLPTASATVFAGETHARSVMNDCASTIDFKQHQLQNESQAGHYPIDAMFGSQNTYGGYNNSYGNAPYYAPPSNSNDPFWGSNKPNNHRNQDPSDSDLYSPYTNNSFPEQPTPDGSLNYIESGISGLRIDQSKQQQQQQQEDYPAPSFASSLSSRKPTSWASIASQPAKSQPKSLKSKMAASGLTGSTSKHLPPSVTMEAMSWDSKNGSINSSKSAPPPPPPTTTNSSVAPRPLSPRVGEDSSPPPPQQQSSPPPQQQQQPQRSTMNQSAGQKDNLWTSNGNSSSSRSTASPKLSMPPPQAASAPMSGGNVGPRDAYGGKPAHNNNSGMHNHNNNSHHHNNNHYHGGKGSYQPYDREVNENYNPNRYGPSHHRANNMNSNNNNHYYSRPNDNPPPPPAYSSGSRHSANYSAPSGGRDHGPDSAPLLPQPPPVPPAPQSPAVVASDTEPDQSPDHSNLLEKLGVADNYNPTEFNLNLRDARFFIIKSYSEDDVHRSIKYSIWCSTEHGNKRLDTAFREERGPIYLLYSVNRSGHFCGIAQMMSPVDHNASSGVWAQDKWKGQFQVKWIYVKDVPNDELRHITLENNENKPVTNSRDTQEVPYEKGKKVLNIIHNYVHRTSLFDDFLHYEKKQEEELVAQRKPNSPPSPPPPQSGGPGGYGKVMMPPGAAGGYGPRDYNNQMPYRGGDGARDAFIPKQHRGYPPDTGRGDYREYRNDYRQSDNNHNRNHDYERGRADRNDAYPPPPPLPSARGFGRDHAAASNRNDSYARNEYRNDYRDSAGPPYGGRDQYARGGDYHQGAPPPPLPPPLPSSSSSRDGYERRDRNDYRPPPIEGRDYREPRPLDHHRDRNIHHDQRSPNQSWRN